MEPHSNWWAEPATPSGMRSSEANGRARTLAHPPAGMAPARATPVSPGRSRNRGRVCRPQGLEQPVRPGQRGGDPAVAVGWRLEPGAGGDGGVRGGYRLAAGVAAAARVDLA